jgi:hypothetical protein
MSPESTTLASRRGLRGLMLALAVASVAAWIAIAPGALAADSPASQSTSTAVKPSDSATLEQCVTSVNQAERSATFAGEMAAIPGAVKLQIRIDVLERMPHEIAFHTVTSPGLSVWRTAAPGVKTYRYLKEVTNLSAPAFYRAAVRFRWLNAKGRLVRAAELRTPRCEQPAGPGGGHKVPEEPARVA